MEKLILVYYTTDGYTYGFNYNIPFEYSSKDDFVYYILELCKEAKLNDNPYIKVFDIDDFLIEDAETIESSVYKYEEWFDKNKMKINGY